MITNMTRNGIMLALVIGVVSIAGLVIGYVILRRISSLRKSALIAGACIACGFVFRVLFRIRWISRLGFFDFFTSNWLELILPPFLWNFALAGIITNLTIKRRSAEKKQRILSNCVIIILSIFIGFRIFLALSYVLVFILNYQFLSMPSDIRIARNAISVYYQNHQRIPLPTEVTNVFTSFSCSERVISSYIFITNDAFAFILPNQCAQIVVIRDKEGETFSRNIKLLSNDPLELQGRIEEMRSLFKKGGNSLVKGEGVQDDSVMESLGKTGVGKGKNKE